MLPCGILSVGAMHLPGIELKGRATFVHRFVAVAGEESGVGS